MKNIAAQMVNFDREQMRRIANNMPEQYDEKPQVFARNGVISQVNPVFALVARYLIRMMKLFAGTTALPGLLACRSRLSVTA